MKLFKNLSLIFLITIIFQINPAQSCTTFCINTDNELVFGKNYDFDIGYGIVLVNKRGVFKTAYTNNEKPAEWNSKYGSVTFNQFGREFPMGGMNEAGLVVELMWLDETVFPSPDDRASVGGILQWIQYQLDNCETIQEVINTDNFLRIPEGSIPVHYLITDKYGNTATIEFLKGQLVQHSGEALKYRTLTNDSYEKSLEYAKIFKGLGGSRMLNGTTSSLDRFTTSCTMLNDYSKEKNGNAVAYGFEILNEVKQGRATKWSIIYDIKNMKVYFKTLDNSNIKTIEFAGLDFSCSDPVEMIDVNIDAEGDIVPMMKEYNIQINRDLIENSYNGVEFTKNIPGEERDKAASYPETLSCGR